MVLHVHRSERADALVEPLAEVIGDPPEDPFAPDVVAVPTRGVERWLAQRLSHRLGTGADGEGGVCANVVFGSPSALVADLLTELLPGTGDADPWDADRLVWPLLEVIDACAGEAWCASLGRHLGVDDADDSHRRGRRLGVARHLAGLFASYAAQRPQLIRSWAGGEGSDGAGSPVPADLAWQPRLWRRVRERLGEPSPAERLPDAVHLLASEPDRTRLPLRLNVFGPTRLPEHQMLVLAALARHRDVHLWLLQPSPVLWQRAADAAGPSRRADRATPARHPLLASMSRDAVELRLRLGALDTPTTDTHHPASPPPPTLLGALQQQLRDDAPPERPVLPGALDLAVLDDTDRSVQVHACHGRARQVEVLREVLVGLFAADPTLEPRDVLVMCPDIEVFAPLVSATFGLAPDDETGIDRIHPGHRLRVRLADRSLRQTNPVLSLLAQLLDLADSRVTASEVLDLAAGDPVRRRFRFDADDLDRLRDWTVAAGARWGEDRDRRARYGLGEVGQNTWDAALDRILLGVVMAEEDQRYIGSALPLDDVDSTDVDLAGRLAELLDRLTGVLQSLAGTRPVAAWVDGLDDALDLLADTAPADGWQLVQARAVLGEVRAAGKRHGDLPLRLPDVRALLAGRLEGRPTRASFRTGHLTMCSLVPMRSVPHRVVCLLGMDDGTFPRGASRDGDDLLLRDPLLGERDRRSEDRQLFLDALLAAGDHLVVLHTGADERTGAARAPAVPVAELLDALDRTARTANGRPARAQVVVRHPLQPFDERNFTGGALGPPGPFSFDGTALAGASAARGERVGDAAFLAGPLPAATPQPVVALDDLVTFVEHPVKTFLRRRLNVTLPSEDDDVADRLPLELDGLATWAVGERLLTARLAGADAREAVMAEWRRGEVPPRHLGQVALDQVGQGVDPLAATAGSYRVGPASAVDLVADLPDGRTLSGTVTGLHDGTLVRATYSRLGPKHRVRAWVQLLALAAGHPHGRWRAVTIGRAGGRRPTPRVSVLSAPAAQDARALLADLVDLRDRGMREPLPMPVGASAAFAAACVAGDSGVQALDAARKAWSPFEAEDGYHAAVWGEEPDLGLLLADAPHGDEGPWFPDEATRFGVLARRLWEPLLAHEQTGTS